MNNSFQPSRVNPFYKPVQDPLATEKARAVVRGILVNAIQDIIKQRGMTQTTASFDARVGRTVITEILRGNLNKISTDRLLRIAYRLGLKTEVKVSRQ